MTQAPVILQFRFASYADSMLQKMNLLRHQRRFCDVTVRLNDLEVQGHKVVFAAGSSFLRDQFILQQDSGEVQITMSQEASVGHQLLLSCYTGQLEFPELELVNYLTVASFLQMGHVVEQCTQALSKFIKPQPREVEVDGGQERSACHSPGPQELLQANALNHREEEEAEEEEEVEDVNEDENDNDVIIQPRTPSPIRGRQRRAEEESDITIIKVESVTDAPENPAARHFPSSPPAALRSPEPQHSLINSTVDSRSMEVTLTPMSCYPLSPATLSPPAGRPNHPGGHQRSFDKPLQWYHQCPKCARVFRQLENYANHLKMHKLFMCLLCGKTFTQKGNLHRHMRVHAGIKPFQCKICGKTFTQKCSLLDHLNLHSGDKPHRCNYCDMVFAHKPVLRKHLKQIHGKNSFDNANERILHNGMLEVDYGAM